MTRRFDVVVIGGGPNGSAVATLLARAGVHVAVFEKQAFPRFQVGESLIPVVNLTLEKLGVLDRMDARRFPRKHGVQFFSPDGKPTRPFYFDEVEDPRMHNTWQVLRSDFDQMMLEHAGRCGAHVQTEAEVVRVIEDEDTQSDTVTGVRIRLADGSQEDIGARVVIDAAGQQGMLVRRFGGRTFLPGLENASVYSHYHDVRRDQGKDAGSTLIYRIDSDSWLWFIPLPDTVSIGLVTPARKMNSFGASREEVLENAIAQSRPLRERMAGARRTMDVRAARDYSYRTSRDGGRGWLLVGDALGFIDPMYSSGLALGMLSAELATKAITKALRGEKEKGQGNGNSYAPLDMAGFARDYQQAFDRFLVLVHAFYSGDVRFSQLAMDKDLRQGLVDMLTGMTTTGPARNVTNALRDSLDSKAGAMMRGR